MEGQCLALRDLATPRKRGSAPGEDSDDEGRGEHKENMYTGKRSTPLKSAESALPALLMSRRGGAPDPTHITPIKHGALAEPWTPTANLKMLISAASPDIRDREMKKVLFRPIENDGDAAARPAGGGGEDDDLAQLDAVAEEEEEDDAERKPSRKQKSLGLLCQKFLALYPDYPPPDPPIWISLDEVANNLGVERRRIYDIVNVLESLVIVGRIAKNSYTWHGRRQLEATLRELQQRGLQHGYHLQMELAAEVAAAGGPGCEEDGAEGDAGSAGSNRKDKSLRIMSQKFVMLFLVSKTQTVTLDAAAKVLIEEGQDSSSHSKYKTKVRRLYDIANVLTSLGLIKKVHVREERGRKPAFKWLGPVEFGKAGNNADVAASALAGSAPELRGKMARHASFHVAPPSAAALRRVSSAPSSPRREPAGLQHQPVDYSKKTASNGAVGRLQFGDHADHFSTPLRGAGSSATAAAPPSSIRPALATPRLFAAPPPHCVAYLPSLSQPSVVMLYRAPESEEGRKRGRSAGEEEEETATEKRRRPSEEEGGAMRAEPRREAAQHAPAGASPVHLATDLSREQTLRGSDHAHPSHFLYVPNTPGFNGLNVLLSAEPSSAGVALPPGGVPTLGPYILLPSHYPLMTGELGFGVSAVMPPAHFVMGASPYGLAADAAPEQRGLPGPAPPLSPSARQHNAGVTREETMTPRTPKETAASSSAAFFQTPGAQGSAVGAAPGTRKRASAQRRLDIGQPLAS